MKKRSLKKALMVCPTDGMMQSMQDAFYRKINPKREQEVMDSRMIHEDNNAVANLSQQDINKIFNANRYMQSLGKNDEFSDI